jgi:Spy/CpxP family protein refolding chaperone
MHRIVIAAMIAALIALGGLALAQDKKEGPKLRGQLPPNWAKLGLTDVQKQQVYKVQSEYQTQIEALQAQIKDLQSKEKAELDKVLTADQKKRLREILDEKVPGAGGATKPEDKKPGNN